MNVTGRHPDASPLAARPRPPQRPWARTGDGAKLIITRMAVLLGTATGSRRARGLKHDGRPAEVLFVGHWLDALAKASTGHRERHRTNDSGTESPPETRRPVENSVAPVAQGMTRRALLRRGAVVGAVVWTTPVLQTALAPTASASADRAIRTTPPPSARWGSCASPVSAWSMAEARAAPPATSAPAASAPVASVLPGPEPPARREPSARPASAPAGCASPMDVGDGARPLPTARTTPSAAPRVCVAAPVPPAPTRRSASHGSAPMAGAWAGPDRGRRQSGRSARRYPSERRHTRTGQNRPATRPGSSLSPRVSPDSGRSSGGRP
jgi:hypothetical protein